MMVSLQLTTCLMRGFPTSLRQTSLHLAISQRKDSKVLVGCLRTWLYSLLLLRSKLVSIGQHEISQIDQLVQKKFQVADRFWRACSFEMPCSENSLLQLRLTRIRLLRLGRVSRDFILLCWRNRHIKLWASDKPQRSSTRLCQRYKVLKAGSKARFQILETPLQCKYILVFQASQSQSPSFSESRVKLCLFMRKSPRQFRQNYLFFLNIIQSQIDMLIICLLTAVSSSVFKNRLGRTINSLLQLYDEIEIEPPAYFSNIVVDSLQLKQLDINKQAILVKITCTIRLKIVIETSIPATFTVTINRTSTPKSRLLIQLESYAFNILSSVFDVNAVLEKLSRQTEEKIDKFLRETDLSKLQMSEMGSRTTLKIKNKRR